MPPRMPDRAACDGRHSSEHFSVKWPRFIIKNAAEEEEHLSVKWARFTERCGTDKVSC
jgi:hypothetical protein